MTAYQVIKFLHQSKYRIISCEEIAKFIRKNRNNQILSSLLKKIFTNDFPAYQSLTTKDIITTNIPANHPLRWFRISNIQFQENKKSDTILKRVIAENNYKNIFTGQEVSCEEAYFYINLFSGSKFGLSESMVKSLLSKKYNAYFYTPQSIDKSFKFEFPVILQKNYQQFRFIGKFFNKNFQVVRSDNKIMTHKFNFLEKFTKILPLNKKIVIDFTLGHESMIQLEKALNGFEPITDAVMTILDMYYQGDTSTTVKRLKRIKKFIAKCKLLGLKNIHIVPSKIITSQGQFNSFVKKFLKKNDSIVIRQNSSFKEKSYKIENQFINESMLVTDYSVKQKVECNMHKIYLDTIKCQDDLGKTVYIKNWTDDINQNIYNLVGKYIKVSWQEDILGNYYPYANNVDNYRLLENTK